ncbi:hypothetical protein ACVRXQ_05125 [Streptococcus panodentis]|uniref:Lipoprotein n=1 Tax=Streptococcus panodentis TaxID=1581472 RepID=A0ABS5AX97_9STRE|nr:hypothetical protein [Streptococcus panodentis]MBP2620876.1 hypothetical protein [Streptococcus panodentis]
MKKGRMFMLAAAAALVVGGTIMTVQNKSLFTDGIFDLRSPREKQLTYLKKHEKDLADFVKALSPKVESVQFDWDSMEVGQVGNGTPQGGGYILTLNGRVNNIKETEFTLGVDLGDNANSIPKELGIYEMQPIRIYRDGGWYYYDEK